MKKIFEKIISICYEETSPQFLSEIASIEDTANKSEDYINSIEEVIEVISIFPDDISAETQNRIQEIYEDSVDIF